MTLTPPPTIVLIRPQMGENIGAAARAMSNFGLTDLRIVAPRDGWPNEKAIAMAAHGEHIIGSAKLFETLPEALAGITTVYATTATRRDVNKPVVTPRVAAARMPANTAILFGPERAGLTNEDVVLADAIIEIPTDSVNPSLNLAQAVCVVAYEYFACHPAAVGEQDLDSALSLREKQNDTPANREELQGFFDQLEAALEEKKYFAVAHKKPLMWQHLRSLFVKARLTEQEVRTLRGMVKHLAR